MIRGDVQREKHLRELHVSFVVAGHGGDEAPVHASLRPPARVAGLRSTSRHSAP